MSRVSARWTEEIRLSILQILDFDPGYANNSHIIRGALEEINQRVSNDKVATELAWLAENNLVTLQNLVALDKPVLMAKLTNRGQDVALGRVRVPGVARPDPE